MADSDMQNNKRLLIAVGLFLLALAVQVDRFTKPSAKVVEARTGPFLQQNWIATPLPKEPIRGLAGASSSLLSALYSAPSTAAKGTDDPISLDEFINLLEKKVPPPVAKKVAAEFHKDPQLQAAWKVYKKTRGTRQPAKEFVDFVTRLPAFRQLVAKFSGDAGFRDAFKGLARDGKVDGVLRAAFKPVDGGKGAAGARSVNQEEIARQWAKKAISGVNLNKIIPGGPGAGRAPGVETAGPSMVAITPGSGFEMGSGRAGAGNTQALTGGGNDNSKEKWDRSTMRDYAGRGKDNYNTDELKEKGISDGQKRSAFEGANKWLDKLLTDLGPTKAYAIKNLLEACETDGDGNRIMGKGPDGKPMMGECDVWAACYASGYYNDCKKACNAKDADGAPVVPECAGTESDPYDACRAYNARSPVTCITDCLDDKKGYGCTQGAIDTGEWDDACLKKSFGDGYCTTSQKYGPCVMQVDGTCKQQYGSRGGESKTLTVAAAGEITDETPVECPPGSGEMVTYGLCVDILAKMGLTIPCAMDPEGAACKAEQAEKQKQQQQGASQCAGFTGSLKQMCETNVAGNCVYPCGMYGPPTPGCNWPSDCPTNANASGPVNDGNANANANNNAAGDDNQNLNQCVADPPMSLTDALLKVGKDALSGGAAGAGFGLAVPVVGPVTGAIVGTVAAGVTSLATTEAGARIREAVVDGVKGAGEAIGNGFRSLGNSIGGFFKR